MTFSESNIQRDTIGRFSEKQGAAPEVSLGGPYETEVVVPLTVKWVEPNVIPPRARKPRDVERELDLEVTVPIVAEEDAPVAISFEGDQFLPGEYRAFNGELYTNTGRDVSELKDVFVTGWRGASSDETTQYGVMMDMQTRANDYLVVGDEVWQKAEEPVYSVATYGMGGNHGSTGLHIESVARNRPQDDRAVSDWVFPLDQRDAAIAKAVEVAESRGDTESIERLRTRTPVVELGEGFVPGSTFRQAPRIKYRSAYELGWNATPEEVEAGFAEYKQQLLTVPGAVNDVPDGWGGTTKRVDLTKLTERQADDYQEYVKRVEGFERR